MKFLCVECDKQMTFEERALAATFKCPKCGRVVAMLTNPMETQLVASLGVQIGGRGVPAQPLETVRGMVSTGRDDAFTEAPAVATTTGVVWTPDAQERLARVPSFVRGTKWTRSFESRASIFSYSFFRWWWCQRGRPSSILP